MPRTMSRDWRRLGNFGAEFMSQKLVLPLFFSQPFTCPFVKRDVTLVDPKRTYCTAVLVFESLRLVIMKLSVCQLATFRPVPWSCQTRTGHRWNAQRCRTNNV